MKSRLLLPFMVLVLVTGLGGCASKFKSDVSSWHQLPRPNGESFVIIAKDPGKSGSIEFSHYAEYLSQSLMRVGYHPARSNETPNLVVRMDYGMSHPRSDVRSTGVQLGVGYHGYHPWGYGPYGYGGTFDGPDIRTIPLYNRFFMMEIAPAREGAENIYESKVISEGRDNRLEIVVPLLIDSLFQDFPGPSGVTRDVVLEPVAEAGP